MVRLGEREAKGRGGVFPASRRRRGHCSCGVRRDELADTDAGVGHEREDRVVAFPKRVRSITIHRGLERVDLVGFEPHAQLNFGVYIIAHERSVR